MTRTPILRELGSALVHRDPLNPADVIVITADSGGAGSLEAADLVREGFASRVAVFADPPIAEDLEFLRRGLPYEDRAERQSRQLMLLGVRRVLRIQAEISGTTDEAELMPVWCRENGFRSVIVIATTDHSRRISRAFGRSMAGISTRLSVYPSRYSMFDPEHWWESRNGVRIWVIEMQKLTLDLALHPFN